MIDMLLKTMGIWFVIVFAAIMNGTIREKILVPIIGSNLALPLSGISLAIIVFVVSFLIIPFIGASEPKIYFSIGLFWVVLTLLFEFIFGHFVAGKPWKDIMQVFNLKEGDLFIVVLCVTAISPWLAAKIRGLF